MIFQTPATRVLRRGVSSFVVILHPSTPTTGKSLVSLSQCRFFDSEWLKLC